MSNKKLGNSFEREFCEILSNNGYWVHNFAQNQSGQPADVIAVKNGKPYLIDCKVCTNGKFALSRVEENQALAMDLWEKCGGGVGIFALRVGDQIYMLSFSAIKYWERYRSTTVGEDDIKKLGWRIDDWMTITS